jgi:uncharacterized membrane protein HdeD (DUF308 family)
MAETVNALPRPREADSHGRISDWPGWDYVPGIAFLVIGALALAEPPLASLAAGIYLGAMICIAGGFMLAGGVVGVKHRGAWLAILLGLLSLAAGLIILFNPIIGAVSLVWVIGAWFMVGGIFEIVSAFNLRAGRGWLIFVGIVNVVLGAYTIMLPPAAAFAFLGYLVGLSLVFRGAWSLMFTGDLHRLHDRVAVSDNSARSG